MQLRLDRSGALALGAVLTLLCIVVVAAAMGRAGTRPGSLDVTVMTRNLYLGADISRPLVAAQDRTGFGALIALGHANHELRQTVDRTDFSTRSRLLAEEITQARPDLIGLQEVALWRHGPMELDRLGLRNATEVDHDFLAMLVADLDAQGVRYDVVTVQEESDVEAPAFTGDPYAGTAQNAQDVRLTVSDVILVRQGSGIRVTDRGGEHYRPMFGVDLAGVPFRFVRGYAWADLAIGDAGLRFVSTHLESQDGGFAAAQAEELLQGLAGLPTQTVIIACDCNADPRSRSGQAGQAAVAVTTYQVLTDTDRFADLWLEQPQFAGGGYTAGLSELVNDPTTAGFDRRLDLLLARPAKSASVTVSHADVTGDELTDRDDRTGLWPSDHAGVVVRLHVG